MRIADCMTAAVLSIQAQAPLAEAHALMRAHGIRHLPVFEGDELVGIVSERDLHLLESLGAGGPGEILVEEAMQDDLLLVRPDTPVTEVARRMANRKAGSALVFASGRLVGIFTAQDALRVLAEPLSPEAVQDLPSVH